MPPTGDTRHPVVTYVYDSLPCLFPPLSTHNVLFSLDVTGSFDLVYHVHCRVNVKKVIS